LPRDHERGREEVGFACRADRCHVRWCFGLAGSADRCHVRWCFPRFVDIIYRHR